MGMVSDEEDKDRSHKLPPNLIKGCLIILGLVVMLVVVDRYFHNWSWYEPSTFIGLLNVLVAALAFWGVVCTVALQSQELGLQRKELAETRRELQRQANSQEKSEKALTDQVSALHRQADAFGAQTTLLIRPYIRVGIRMQHDTLRILEIENTGKSPALQLAMKFDKEFYTAGFTGTMPAVHGAYTFQNVIPVFSPGMKILFPLAPGNKLKESTPEDSKLPLVFTLTVAYLFGEHTYNETHEIDLRLFNDSMVERNFELDRLTKISASLESIAAELAAKNRAQ